MATVSVQYTWPEGGTLTVVVKAKARNVEALGNMRIDAKRLWAESLGELAKVDGEAAASDA